ncbi:TadE/TadG family type IV pilus assembly protein [Nocardioides cavernaquae]|uniref:Pilus assembly protein n=1 Tax=Nocardioides cavernaquae TaxID=2321396 RepID=A0A3A5H2I4_9ACTN|nr:TadE/TadG family type IV pilus assembly protein [Nocardioides cavernaquae]RJS44932.1 pilus assembly protein [Nocardioides cavernaquae]
MSRCAALRARAGRTDRSKDRDERGASAVEFAMLLPFLALFIFGIIAYSYMFSVRQAITQATAEGARAGAVATPGNAATEARSAIDDALSGYDLSCTTTGVNCVTSVSGGSITVSVDYAYKANSKLQLPLIPMPSSLKFTSQARIN